MKIRILSLLCILPIFAFCKTTEISSLPRSNFFDTEVSTNIPYCVSQDGAFAFSLSLPISITQSNNVEIAFGKDDASRDRHLSEVETLFKFGWDSGHYFLQNSDGMVLSATSQYREEKLVFSAHANIGNDGFPKRFAIRENGELLLSTTNLNSIVFPSIDLVKVTIRGIAISQETISIKTAKNGIVISVR